MSTTYSVVLQLSTTGSLDAKLNTVGQKAHAAHSAMSTLGEMASKAGERIRGMGESVGGMVEGVVDKVVGIGEAFAKVAVAGTMAAAVYGVGHLNNELEQTQISLGAIAQAQGFASTFEQGFAKAGEQVRLMKQDVKTLPGDLGQLSNMMKMIATPAAQGGASLDEIRKLAGRTMLTSTILGVPQEVAAREMANLLAGRAGAHNILGSRMGFIGAAAKSFNAESAAERLKAVNKALDGYSGATDRFAKSFIANWTTLKDNIKYSVLAEATNPLFERVKQSLATINTWFDHNTDRVKAFTTMVGKDLAGAWDLVGSKIQKLGPIFGRFEQFMDKMTARKAEGMLARAGLAVVGAKLAGPAIAGGASALGGALSMGGSMAKIAGSATMMSALGEAMTVLANPVTLGAAAAAMGLLATAAVAVVGAIHALTDETSSYHEYAVQLWTEIQQIGGEAIDRIKVAVENVMVAVTPFVDAMGTNLLFVLREMAPVAIEAASALEHFASFMTKIINIAHNIPGLGSMVPGAGGAAGPGAGRGQTSFGEQAGKGGKMAEGLEGALDKIAKRGGGGGGGGTHVQKVEIVVNSNQDPSRVARFVALEFRKWERNPRSSPHATDYAASAHE